MNITRRTALGLMGAVAVPSAAVAGVALATAGKPAPAVETPQQEVDRLVVELEAAMTKLHGGCNLILPEFAHHPIIFFPPPRRRAFEFAGPGLYEVKDKGIAPIMFVERAPFADDPVEGRCYKAVPQVKRLGTRYYYEHDLQKVLGQKFDGRSV